MAGTFLEELSETIRTGFCTVANVAQDFGLTAGVSAGYRGAFVSVNLLRLGQRLVCNREPAPGYDPPFTGGQCPVNYSIVVDIYACVTAGCGTDPNLGVGTYLGPILAVTGAFKPGSGWGVYITTPSGTPFFTISSAGPTAYVSWDAVNIRCTRVDGLPDNCGNPSPQLPPSEPGDRTTTTTLTYTDNSSDDHSFDVTLRYGDINFNSNGDLTIPVRITYEDNGSPATFNANLSLTTGDISFNLGNSNYGVNGSTNPDKYGTPEAPDIPPDVETPVTPPSSNDDETETTKVLAGVIVTVTANSSDATEIFQTDNPSIYAPNLGYVNFSLAFQGTTAWSVDYPVKNYRCFIPSPLEGSAIDVKGTPRVGVTWSLTPVYSDVNRPTSFG